MNINPFDILKNANRIQEQMGAFQKKVAEITVTGAAGGGMAEVDMNGKMEVLALRITPEAMEDPEMLQDLVAAAFNSALEKIRDEINQELGNLFPGSVQAAPWSPGIPGMPGMPGFPV
jgi:hypothetical protein